MGPLKGLKVIEIAGVGPGPFAAMMLADMGAEVIRVERPGGTGLTPSRQHDFLGRGRRCIAVDLKKPEGVKTVLKLIESAEALIEGFRPGVMEKLGLGPEVCEKINSKLVYGRMTGWGQDGPLAQHSGHDINYISITGALGAIGNKGEKPAIPGNLVGDFGGGGMFMAYGIVCGVLEARVSGKGQVVDCSMVEGAAALMTTLYASQQLGFWKEERGTNIFDSGSHFYNTYETSDGGHVSVGPFEAKFYAQLLSKLGIEEEGLPHQMDNNHWESMSKKFADIFITKTRDQWCEVFEGSDACFTPVLKISEAYDHPHNVARGTFVEYDGVIHPRPTPRFSRTDNSQIQSPPAAPGQHTDEVLLDWGFNESELETLHELGAIV